MGHCSEISSLSIDLESVALFEKMTQSPFIQFDWVMVYPKIEVNMNTNMTNLAEENNYSLEELQKESRMGALGQETFEREVRVIDLSDFEQRKYDIADQPGQLQQILVFFKFQIMALI